MANARRERIFPLLNDLLHLTTKHVLDPWPSGLAPSLAGRTFEISPRILSQERRRRSRRRPVIFLRRPELVSECYGNDALFENLSMLPPYEGGRAVPSLRFFGLVFCKCNSLPVSVGK